MPLTLVSFVGCVIRGASAWRPEDYHAYKFVRALGGRRIAGSAWIPTGDGRHWRLNNATRAAGHAWLIDRAYPFLRDAGAGGRRTVLIPFPDPGRVVGAPPSRSRIVAQALADATGLRVLDVLRWRQPMPRCRRLDAQACADNLITTSGLVQADAVLVAEYVADAVGLQVAAARLTRQGAQLALTLAAGRVVDTPDSDPFSTSAIVLPEVVAAGL